MTASRLSWICATCGKPIVNGKGYLSLSGEKMAAYREAMAVHKVSEEAAHLDDKSSFEGGVLKDMAGLWNALELRPSWVPYHFGECDKEPSELYSIEVSRLRTTADILSWTLHFGESKDYLRSTNWVQMAHAKVPHFA